MNHQRPGEGCSRLRPIDKALKSAQLVAVGKQLVGHLAVIAKNGDGSPEWADACDDYAHALAQCLGIAQKRADFFAWREGKISAA